MTWFGWVLVALFALSALTTISQVRKPRTPTTQGMAVFVVLCDAAIIIEILTVGTGRGI